MCNTSQCKLRSTFRNLRVPNVICIVTCYTLPLLESPDSFWMTWSQRSWRRDKGIFPLMNRKLWKNGRQKVPKKHNFDKRINGHTCKGGKEWQVRTTNSRIRRDTILEEIKRNVQPCVKLKMKRFKLILYGERHGFLQPIIYLRWSTCYDPVKSTNDAPTAYVVMHRGVRQGGMLSPSNSAFRNY